jgi:hypothetical protein
MRGNLALAGGLIYSINSLSQLLLRGGTIERNGFQYFTEEFNVIENFKELSEHQLHQFLNMPLKLIDKIKGIQDELLNILPSSG